jgi:hypothetical protein
LIFRKIEYTNGSKASASPKYEDKQLIEQWLSSEEWKNVPRGTPPPPVNGTGIPIFEAGLMIKDKEVVMHEYEVEGPDFFVQIPQYRDCDYGTRATGDRMYPEIRNGDLLICKSVPDMETIMLGDIYVMQLRGGTQTVSYIHLHENEDFFLLKARHEKFPDTPMEKSKIVKIWKVRAVFKGL